MQRLNSLWVFKSLKLEVIYLKLLMSIDLTPGMVLAEEVTAKDDLPPFRASVMVKYSFFYKVLGRLCDQE